MRDFSNIPQCRMVTHTISRKVRFIAWMNILFQLLFPLSLLFTPIIVSASATHAQPLLSFTEPYILRAGENAETVARKYEMSVDELEKINALRTFSKPFDALTEGDEIDVPRKRSPFSVDNSPTIPATEPLTTHLASGATVLSSSNVATSAGQLARSAASNEFNSSAQQWLSQFGTAQVELNVNDDFNLDGSAVDALFPLYNSQQYLLFTQLGVRNKDSRNTFNTGVGFRTFKNRWMYGANTFFDNDITGNNRRIGVGAETWADYLKLSANGYFGLTDWHQSRDFADYNERPANGYDVRVEAYLPFYPQLGGKLMYEKYRGDEVALFNKDNRQKNPHSVTAGVNYTPIPLLTVGAEHRAGKEGQSDSNISLQFNYRLGESWQSHLNSSAVATSRTLAGSRYDLIARNNNIVLDYQKQEGIRLDMPEQLIGVEEEWVTLTAQVTSQRGVQRVEWDDTSLKAAGGSVTAVSLTILQITLPPYQQDAHASNSYALSAVAYDDRGKASNRATTQVIVKQAEPGPPVDPVVITGVKTNVGIYEATFAANAGFPKTGFAGAKFLLETGKDASNYDWSSNDNAVVVNTLGEVTINDIPHGAVVITIANKSDPVNQVTYRFQLTTWFIRNDGSLVSPTEADEFCAAQPGGYSTISFKQVTNVVTPGNGERAVRAPNGRLISEWGNMAYYNSAWEGDGNLGHWAKESDGVYRYLVGFGYGLLNLRNPAEGFRNHVACSRTL